MWLTKKEIARRYHRQIAANVMLHDRIDQLQRDLDRMGRDDSPVEANGRVSIETRRPVRETVIEWWNEFSYVLDLAATLAILRAGWRTGKALVP
jgi:hypothetical protein